MIDLQAVNFRDLEREWFRGQAPERAIGHIDGAAARGDLPVLLRHHGEREVVDLTEIGQRDDVDDLLSFCSLLELASLSGFTAARPSGRGAEELQRVLEMAPLRQFYTQHYPVKLPRLFLRRLRGERSDVEPDVAISESLFRQFTSLTEPIVKDPDVRRFTRLLDDFTLRGGFRLQHLEAVLGDLAQFMDHVTRAPEESNSLSSASRGFLRFANFAVEFRELLGTAEPCPNLRAGMWHYHSYWLVELRAPLSRVTRHFEKTAVDYARNARLARADIEALRGSLAEQFAALELLCDPAWGTGI